MQGKRRSEPARLTHWLQFSLGSAVRWQMHPPATTAMHHLNRSPSQAKKNAALSPLLPTHPSSCPAPGAHPPPRHTAAIDRQRAAQRSVSGRVQRNATALQPVVPLGRAKMVRTNLVDLLQPDKSDCTLVLFFVITDPTAVMPLGMHFRRRRLPITQAAQQQQPHTWANTASRSPSVSSKGRPPANTYALCL